MSARSVLLLVPHPDDEVVGCAVAIRRAQAGGARFFALYLTTGVPPRESLWPWQRSGHGARVARRRAEAMRAAALLGITPAGFCDWPARGLKAALASALARIRATIAAHGIGEIWTPAWEGAHQDHDVANFLAAQLLPEHPVIEFAEYHLAGGHAVSGRFKAPDGRETVVRLDPEEQRWKQQLLALYRSERGNLAHIACKTESFRPLARYDYAARPHEGRLFYERFQWVPFRHPRIDFERPERVLAALAAFRDGA
ncbi:MAG TPA: PIG-L family deacetylase [Stellaceae bacterium]|nr:PIG-L family deacetylase [Stellaceae bacterium]